MTDVYRQEVQQLISDKPKKHFFRNKRGRVIIVTNESEIKKLIQQGFLICTKKDWEKGYNLTMDKGDVLSNSFPKREKRLIDKEVGDITFIEI